MRDLLEQARDVTQAIKPCFLMPPLAVSQHLPPGMRFDVVIFDEASLISPADAINCIYRSSAVILAGDPNQLPPASAFHGGVLHDGEECPGEPAGTCDPQSVLHLAKESGTFGNLALRWHYRSRHEALIAPKPGSNCSTEKAPPGAERRGTTPDEAALVAQRIIHHYHTRPASAWAW